MDFRIEPENLPAAGEIPDGWRELHFEELIAMGDCLNWTVRPRQCWAQVDPMIVGYPYRESVRTVFRVIRRIQ